MIGVLICHKEKVIEISHLPKKGYNWQLTIALFPTKLSKISLCELTHTRYDLA